MIESSVFAPSHTVSARVPRIGLLGTGHRGVRCFGSLLAGRDDCELAAMADANPVRLAAAAGELGFDGPLYNSPESLLAAGDLDGLIITTPDYLHADHVALALEAGVPHILVDKPVATDAAGCRKVMAALEQNRRRDVPSQVAIGFNLRHLPLISRIKEVIDQGEIGELMLMENREYYSGGKTYMARWNRKYALSGGLWVHKGSHDFDVFNWWNAGGNPVRVFASGGLNALRPDKLPFTLQPGRPAGPNCSTCSYAGECPDYTPAPGGVNLFDAQSAKEDNYVRDLCIYLSDKDVHDNGISMLEYDNNVRASHLECFVCSANYRQYTVSGHKGTLTASTSQPEAIVFNPRWGAERIIDVPLSQEGGHGGADPLLVDNFISGIVGRGHHSSSIRDGVRAVAVGAAAEISMRQGRAVEIGELLDLNSPGLT